jgi:osmotically-inducible protein OsmY
MLRNKKKNNYHEVDGFSEQSQEKDSHPHTSHSFISGGLEFGGGIEEAEKNFSRFGKSSWDEVEQRHDYDILHNICEKMIENNFFGDEEIKVQIDHGRVFLSGYVKNWEMKKLVENLILDVPGVKDIVNGLWFEI